MILKKELKLSLGLLLKNVFRWITRPFLLLKVLGLTSLKLSPRKITINLWIYLIVVLFIYCSLKRIVLIKKYFERILF